jgi:hypothetical protein
MSQGAGVEHGPPWVSRARAGGTFCFALCFWLDAFGSARALENGASSKTGPLRSEKALSSVERSHDGSRSLIGVVEAARGQPEGIEIAMVA